MIWRIILTLACLIVACQAETTMTGSSWIVQLMVFLNPHMNGLRMEKKIVTDPSTNIVVSGGRLELTAPDFINVGLYQCFASNLYGRSMSTVVDIKKAYMDGYPTLPIISKEFNSGDHAVLECRNQPKSYPPALVGWYWSRIDAIETSAKVVLDQSGSLHFINVEKVNEPQGDKIYICSLYNSVAQVRNYGSPTRLKVNALTGPIPPRSPIIAYYTPDDEAVAILRSIVTIQCIPDGYPIPTIEWSKNGGELPVGRHEIFPLEYKLEIRNVSEIDEGRYTCTAVHGNNRISQGINVNVKSEPIWVVKMRSLTVTEGKTATFECIARSAVGEIDNVIVKWFKNSAPLNPGTTGKITVSGTRLTVANVVKPDDLTNFQCKVSNTIGYQMADAFLNVIKNTILTVTPKDNVTIDPGKAVEVHIAAVADPLYANRLTYTWTKDDVPVGKDPKQYVYVDPAHTLVINATKLGRDEVFLQVLGNYSCYVTMRLEGEEGDITTYTKVSSDEEEKNGNGIVIPIIPVIVGSGIGSLVFITLLIVVGVIVYRRKQSSPRGKDSTKPTTDGTNDNDDAREASIHSYTYISLTDLDQCHEQGEDSTRPTTDGTSDYDDACEASIHSYISVINDPESDQHHDSEYKHIDINNGHQTREYEKLKLPVR